MTGQPIASQVMCLACYTPTPRQDLAHDEHGIRTDLCRWCAGENIDGEPSWVDLTRPTLRRVADLPDIDQYWESK